ncbi:MAG: hypothetical protein JSS66_05670 [Armatimonadetes bacterium]|nr:hypothetical protein [Armatimonadota bacterium]
MVGLAILIAAIVAVVEEGDPAADGPHFAGTCAVIATTGNILNAVLISRATSHLDIVVVIAVVCNMLIVLGGLAGLASWLGLNPHYNDAGERTFCASDAVMGCAAAITIAVWIFSLLFGPRG